MNQTTIRIFEEWCKEQNQKGNTVSYTQDFRNVTFDREGSNQYNIAELIDLIYEAGFNDAIASLH